MPINQAVILAGGLGMRMREESSILPKPMIEIGSIPLIEHVIDNISRQGINNILVLLGYKGDVIKDYFFHYKVKTSNVRINLKNGEVDFFDKSGSLRNLTVTLVDTGTDSLTGERLLRAIDFLDEEFILTYGDGLSNVNLVKLFASHKLSGLNNTVTVTSNPSRFGVINRDSNNRVLNFREKPSGHDLVNMGYFVLNKEDVKEVPKNTMLENEFMHNLVSMGKLNSYYHDGFFLPVDTPRDIATANEMFGRGQAPWKEIAQ